MSNTPACRLTARLLGTIALLAYLLVTPSTAEAATGGLRLSPVKYEGYVAIIRTCLTNDVSSGASGCLGPRAVNIQTWYGPRSNCTHAYPQADLFADGTAVRSFNEIFHVTGLNCNYMVAYLNNSQGGGGAVGAVVLEGHPWLIRTNRLYHSLSISNRR